MEMGGEASGGTTRKSRTDGSDHRSQHLLGIRVKVGPPPTWATTLPHPSM